MLMRTPTRWTKPTRRAPPGFILPAQPVLALKAPIGPGWLFAVKHDGFRIVARKEGDDVHLWSRNGRDWCAEFSGITTALKAWKLKSFVLDGEACACDDSGWPDFNALLGGGKACADACFFAFDLLALDGIDLRHLPFSERYAKLARMLAGAPEAINLCEHTADYSDLPAGVSGPYFGVSHDGFGQRRSAKAGLRRPAGRLFKRCSDTTAGLSTILAGSARPAIHSGEMLGHV
jgi:hypothetical protein